MSTVARDHPKLQSILHCRQDQGDQSQTFQRSAGAVAFKDESPVARTLLGYAGFLVMAFGWNKLESIRGASHCRLTSLITEYFAKTLQDAFEYIWKGWQKGTSKVPGMGTLVALRID